MCLCTSARCINIKYIHTNGHLHVCLTAEQAVNDGDRSKSSSTLQFSKMASASTKDDDANASCKAMLNFVFLQAMHWLKQRKIFKQ